MEVDVLTKIGLVINWIVGGGYAFAGSYVVRIGLSYFKDYKDYEEEIEQ